MSAKEMFEELGYEYYNDDGFTEYLKATPIPNRINTNYIKFKKITFNRMDEEMSIFNYKKDALCQELLDNATYIKINYLTSKEIKAINQQCKELGWIE